VQRVRKSKKTRGLTLQCCQLTVPERRGWRGEGEDRSSESRAMVAWNVYEVNKIIYRLRSNGKRREVADG